MAIAIPLDRVQQVLAIRIGTALAHSGVGTHAAERLRHYRVGDDLSALCEALRDGLFRDLYAILGPQMRVSMPDGRTRRFRMEEFPLLADELLAVLFESLGTTGMPKDMLMAFAMTSGSLYADAILPAVIGGKSAAGADPSGKRAAGSHCIPQSTTVLGRNHHHMKTKKLLAALLTLLIFLSPTFAAAETVVTSFYPIYLFALNLTQGIDGITIRNLAAPNTGCLHDYQLSTGDMKVLNKADVFLINGAGMESYLTRVMDTFPKLPVVDASAGITLLTEDGMGEYVDDHDHDHEEEDADDHGHHHAGEANAHIWLDAQNAIQMVDNLADGLISAMPQYEAQIEQNRADYVSRLTALDEELKATLAAVPNKNIVTFHEAFPYFARAYGLTVAAVVNHEPGDALSPAQLAELVRTIRELNNPPLFTEPQYDDMAAQTISRETGAPIYTLDPVVTGPETDVPLTYYEDRMRENMQTLLVALTPAEGE